MNTRKSRAKPKVKDDTPIKDVLTPNNSSAKKALLSSCRRLGLGRKKAVNSSPVVSDLKPENASTPIHTTASENCEGPSTSQVPASCSTPMEEIPKSSASRRKKSPHPVKRTIDDTDKTEGNTFTVLISPIPKKRKYDMLDIFNSDNNAHKSPILNNIDDETDHLSNVKNSDNNLLPNNIKRHPKVKVNSSVKNKQNADEVSLPEEINKKHLNRTTKASKVTKNISNVRGLKSDTSVKTKKNVVRVNDFKLKTCETTDILINDYSVTPPIETKPIKKRKSRAKKDKAKEIVNKEIIETIYNDPGMILINTVHEEDPYIFKEEDTIIKPKSNPKSKKKSKLEPSYFKNTSPLKNTSTCLSDIGDFDDDFIESTPRNKNKIIIKNKKIVEPKIKIQKPKAEKINKQTNKRNKKNTRRKVNTDDKNFDDTVLLSDVELKQTKTRNENLETLDKNTVHPYVDSNLNTKVSNVFPDQLILHENDLKQHNNTENKQEPLPSCETVTYPICKNKAEKKSYDSDLPLSIKLSPTRKSPLKKRDAKSPPKLCERPLFKKDEKYKMDEHDFAYNEDSCDSSHYSAPDYSPIEETRGLPEDKELIIKRCEVKSPKKYDFLYECHIKNSQSPVKNECVSSFVESSTTEDFNLPVIKAVTMPNIEKILCQKHEEVTNSSESSTLNALSGSSKKQTKNDTRIKKHEIQSNVPKISRKLRSDKQSNIIAKNDSPVVNLKDNLLNDKRIYGKKLRSARNKDILEDDIAIDKSDKLDEVLQAKDLENIGEIPVVTPSKSVAIHREVVLGDCIENSRTVDELQQEKAVQNLEEKLPDEANNFGKKLTPSESVSVHNDLILEDCIDKNSTIDDVQEKTGGNLEEILPEETSTSKSGSVCNDVFIEVRSDISNVVQGKAAENLEEMLPDKANDPGRELTSSKSNSIHNGVILDDGIDKPSTVDASVEEMLPEETEHFSKNITSSDSISVHTVNLEDSIDKSDKENRLNKDLTTLEKGIDKPNTFDAFQQENTYILEKESIANEDVLEFIDELVQENVVEDLGRSSINEGKSFNRERRSRNSLSANKNVLSDKCKIGKIPEELEQQKVLKTSVFSKRKTELLNYYPRVLINLDDIPNYFAEIDIRRKIADEKIYRVNKTTPRKRTPRKSSVTPNSRKRKRKNSVEPMPEKNFDSHIQEKNFIITRVESYADVSDKIKYKNNETVMEKHTESVFFTPPSSRSENDSDSNRNDFQIDAELSLINNPFGEGTSRQGLSDISEMTSPSITAKSNLQNLSPEDREVASISSKSTVRKRDKVKEKRKTILPVILPPLTNDSSFEYDSDDDFQTPKTQPKKIPSKNYLIKNDSGVKSIIKQEPCNRLEIFPLKKNTTVTAIHRGLCIEYARATDYYAKPEPVQTSPKISAIQKQCSYLPNERITSIFDSVVDNPESYISSNENVTPRKISKPISQDILDEIKQIEQRIKEKQAKIEHLNRINIYKKKHNVENLRKASLQMTKGAQEALLELAANLRQRSEGPFDIGTLLDNMSIPHHVVGYNMDLDEFT